MRATSSRTLALLVLTLALTACGADPTPDRSPDPEDPTVTTEQPTPSGPAPAPGPSPTAVPSGDPDAEAAVRDLAGRLGISADDVTVVRSAAVTWRDGALGCPQRGMAYTQALTPGRLVELEAGGRTYRYHSGPRRGPFLCERPQAPLETDA
ncbi:hypothetical protein [Georgenia faecalis]|uniref:PASTA domain-containing protein n=1 Tax=Georgenia faecalis TaxID=2483799 RepID=A0ABV9DBA3_9MICO|nr:hypothetical protein [Georgenia faecalis]